METAKQIAALRNGAGMTQQELAEKLFVSRDLVAKWETGRRRPDRENVEKMADIFGVSGDRIHSPDAGVLSELEKCLPEKGSLDPDALPAILDGFLKTLPERERNVFIRRCHFLDSAAEIGDRYALRESHVRTILTRTRSKLKKYLEEKGK